jgi:hypothetical protein
MPLIQNCLDGRPRTNKICGEGTPSIMADTNNDSLGRYQVRILDEIIESVVGIICEVYNA